MPLVSPWLELLSLILFHLHIEFFGTYFTDKDFMNYTIITIISFNDNLIADHIHTHIHLHSKGGCVCLRVCVRVWNRERVITCK